MNIQVAVVDDHDLVRLGIEQLLSVTPHLTYLAGFADVRSLYLDPRGQHADVVILDDTLPWMSVHQAVAQIGAQWPQAVPIILGCTINAEDMRSLTDPGVLGFIC